MVITTSWFNAWFSVHVLVYGLVWFYLFCFSLLYLFLFLFSPFIMLLLQLCTLGEISPRWYLYCVWLSRQVYQIMGCPLTPVDTALPCTRRCCHFYFTTSQWLLFGFCIQRQNHSPMGLKRGQTVVHFARTFRGCQCR